MRPRNELSEEARQAAVENVMRLFWSEGAESASYDSIVEATGLSRKALYAQWPEKTALANAALTRYRQQVLDPVIALLAAEGRAGLEAFWAAVSEVATAPDWQGCLLFRSASGAQRRDAHVRSMFDAHVTALRDAVASAVAQAAADGTIRPRDPQVAGWQSVSIAALLSSYGGRPEKQADIAGIVRAGKQACGLIE